jgi:hypothetical protein
VSTAFHDRFDWFPCPAKDVRAGDVYANNASVTASRKAKKGEWYGDPVNGHKGRHTIKCGKSLRVTTDAESIIVIGRKKAPADIKPPC